MCQWRRGLWRRIVSLLHFEDAEVATLEHATKGDWTFDKLPKERRKGPRGWGGLSLRDELEVDEFFQSLVSIEAGYGCCLVQW